MTRLVAYEECLQTHIPTLHYDIGRTPGISLITARFLRAKEPLRLRVQKLIESRVGIRKALRVEESDDFPIDVDCIQGAR